MTEENVTNVWKEISASWDGVDGYLAENQAGETVLLGKYKDGEPGISPMELLLMGLAGCTAIDIVDILRKKRQVPLAFKIKVRGNQRVDEYPKVFTEFMIEYILWGDNLVPRDVEQAIHLSEEKYCSVGGTLAKAGPINSGFRILKAGEKLE